MKTKELRQLVEKAMKRQREVAKALDNDSNPQVVATYRETRGRVDAYKAVLEAIDAPRASAAFALLTDGRSENKSI